jgi:hypothetical protein
MNTRPVLFVRDEADKSMDPRIGHMATFFLHIPKTAGTAVRHFLEGPLHRDEIVRVDSVADEVRQRQHEPYGPHVKFVSGHLPFWFSEALSGKSQTLLFLRHPVDRVLSTFFFWKNLPQPSPEDCSPQAELLRRMRDIGLDEFVLSSTAPARGAISNYSCRLVGHTSPWTLETPFNQEAQALACSRLEEVEMLGIVERMPESLTLISQRLGIPFTGSLLRQNTTEGRRDKSEISPEIIRAILDLNDGDMALWERGQAELDRRMQSASPSTPAKHQNERVDDKYEPPMRGGELTLLPGEDPILGGGWFAPERNEAMTWRCVANGTPATLEVPLPVDQALLMVIDSPFAVPDLNYARLKITVNGELIDYVLAPLPDRTLIIGAPGKPSKSRVRQISIEYPYDADLMKPPTDSRDVAFAVRSIKWLVWSTQEDSRSWRSMRTIVAQLSQALSLARQDKADTSAYVASLLKTLESKDCYIQALTNELATQA